MAVKRVLYDHKTAYPDDYITVVSATGVMQRLYLRIGVDNVNDLKMRIKEADKSFLMAVMLTATVKSKAVK